MSLRTVQSKFPQSTPWLNEYPILSLHQRMNNVFREFCDGSELAAVKGSDNAFPNFVPTADLIDRGETFQIQAELPGLTEQDIALSVEPLSVTIKGEKKFENENKGNDFYRAERSYGAFCRVIALPAAIQQDKTDAVFKNGVLTVTLPKSPDAQSSCRKISIKKSN